MNDPNDQNTLDKERHKIHMRMLSRAGTAKDYGVSTVVLIGYAVDVALELIAQAEKKAEVRGRIAQAETIMDVLDYDEEVQSAVGDMLKRLKKFQAQGEGK